MALRLSLLSLLEGVGEGRGGGGGGGRGVQLKGHIKNLIRMKALDYGLIVD